MIQHTRRGRPRAVMVTLAALVLATAAPAGGAVAAVPAHHSVSTKPACPVPTSPLLLECMALIRTDVPAQSGLLPQVEPRGYGPQDLRSAYRLPSSLRRLGRGKTLAVVDAFDDPNAESDLAVYRTQFGLPACTTANGCFRKVDQRGGTAYPPADPGWAVEVSLDLDMASAICPNCKILLVEADDNSVFNLPASVDTAVRLGARAVSNSYGGPEFPGDPDYNVHYDHPGVAITVSSGDFGYGVDYPAASPYVTAVGGTTLNRAADRRGWTESAWSGAGSGCSLYEFKPRWQRDRGCAMRTVADVSAVADPATGVAVYDTYLQSGWLVVGGTSVAAPLIAGVYALADPAVRAYPASYPYARPRSLYDITTGSNGMCSPAYLCTAEVGYDGPTGLGTPRGLAAFLPAGLRGLRTAGPRGPEQAQNQG